MSLELQGEADESAGTFPDVSLGSLESSSSFHSPPLEQHQPPSVTSLSTAPSSTTLSTPSPSHSAPNGFQRRKGDQTATPTTTYLEDDQDRGAIEGKDELLTPVASRAAKRGPSGMGVSKSTVNLTLRDQEKVIDSLKKENFSLKLKVHFLEERLNQLAPEHVETALKQNINLKIEVQSRGVELKKYKKLLLELEKELQNAQKGIGGSKAREQDLEQALMEREREVRELRRRRAVGPEDGALREAEARSAALEERQAELEDQLDGMKAIIGDNAEEIARLNGLVDKRNQSITSDGSGESRRARLERKLAELENENDDLQARHESDTHLLAQREEEKEALEDKLERMRLELEDLERRREAETLERSESRAQVFEEREVREAIEDDLNAVRDQLAATTIELQQREDDLDLKCHEFEEMLVDHKHEIQTVHNGWRGELEEMTTRMEEQLAAREAECRDLRAQIEESQEDLRDAHAKFEAAMEHLERESELKDDEIAAANLDIERLGQRVWELEDEGEKLKEEIESVKQEAVADREALDSMAAALKEKLASAKTQLQQMTALYEQCHQEIFAHREREEELGRHVGELASQVQAEREAREHLEAELETLERNREDDERKHRRTLEDKESEIRSAVEGTSRQAALISERDGDLANLHAALKTLEAETRRAGESHTNDKFSLELELDRLRRDVARMEDDLSRARAELADHEAKTRERDSQLDMLYNGNRDLTNEVATLTQARLNLTEKLDGAQANLKTAEAELTNSKARLSDLEQRLSQDQRSLLSTELHFRDQLEERNVLLLTVYQQVERVLGVDKPPKSGVDIKPFTNFPVFHDNLKARLKALSQIQSDFDRGTRESEARFTQKLTEIKKQLDNRWKQIDAFEMKVKGALENKHSWRRKYMAKEGELEAVKTSNAELISQLSHIKGSPSSKDSEIRALTARNTNSERRLVNSQNQLASAEERNAYLTDKLQSEKQQWEARVKEYESRLKSAEEKVKRERQGSKERVTELENHIKTLSKQIDLAKQRNAQLSDLADKNKFHSTGR